MTDRDQNANGNLSGCTVYLSGPMDFLAQSREEERKHGWRTRVAEFLKRYGVNVLDPWHKPEIRALHGYGQEDAQSTANRNRWTFGDGEEARITRAEICSSYWPTLHIDLRMVDKSDFLIAFCPTNTYSVGTVHEIAMARQQHKPVLFVSPPIPLRALAQLSAHLAERNDEQGLAFLQELKVEQPMKENINGAPSLWYMGMLPGDYFFNGFGFCEFKEEFAWSDDPFDEIESEKTSEGRFLLPFLRALDKEIPDLYDPKSRKFVPNDDWLLFAKSAQSS